MTRINSVWSVMFVEICNSTPCTSLAIGCDLLQFVFMEDKGMRPQNSQQNLCNNNHNTTCVNLTELDMLNRSWASLFLEHFLCGRKHISDALVHLWWILPRNPYHETSIWNNTIELIQMHYFVSSSEHFCAHIPDDIDTNPSKWCKIHALTLS